MELTNFIDGEFAQLTRSLPVIEPATGREYARVAESSGQDLQQAIRAAKAAFPAWSALSNGERAQWLRKLADAMQARGEALAQAECRDSGKPISVTRQVEIPRAISNFQFFASAAETYGSESHATPSMLHYTLRQPLGVVACISPWNLPLYLLTWKIAPALAFGNTVVAKPSEITPLTAFLLAQCAQEINFPPGVLNMVHGTGTVIGSSLVSHREIKAVSFTGSTQTGKRIAEATASSFKKLSLEMGGKNASVVFADCDLESAAREVARAAFSNQGQICLCGSRVLVQKSIMSKFREAFLLEAQSWRAADPELPDTRFGALVSSAHLHKIENAVATAHQEGGRLLLGGERVRLSGRCEEGYFFAPTVFDQLANECSTNQQEIFGPVCSLIAFDDPQQAVLLANASDYGLAATLFTQDLQLAHRVAAQVHVGLVWVHAWMQRDLRVPFGGVKQSGLGREGGMDAYRFFTDAKSVGVAL